VSLGIHLLRRISLNGEGNALYSVLSSLFCVGCILKYYYCQREAYRLYANIVVMLGDIFALFVFSETELIWYEIWRMNHEWLVRKE